MPLWNDLNLKAPDGDVCAYEVTDTEIFDKISSLVTLLAKASCQLGRQHPAWAEMKIFWSLWKRLSFKVPCDKFLHMMKRIGRCIQNLIAADISTVYFNFAQALLNGLKEASQIAVLPSQQQLEFVLIRSQGFAALLCQAVDLCQNCFVYLLQRMNLGHHTQSLLMASAAVARISIMFKAFLLQLCEVYKNLKSVDCALKKGSWCWDEDPDLPDDLLAWLGSRAEDLLKVQDLAENKLFFLSNMFEQGNKAGSLDNISNSVSIADSLEESGMDYGEVLPRTPNISRNDIQEAETQVDSSSAYKDISSVQALIKNAKSVKSLLEIFKCLHSLKNMNNGCPRIKSIKNVKRILRQLKVDIAECRSKRGTKSYQKKMLVIQAKKSLMKELSFGKAVSNKTTENSIPTSGLSSPVCSLKPVKTFSDLRTLFVQLLEILSVHKRNKRLKENLKQLYLEGRKNAKLLKISGDSNTSKKILLKTSKKMLALSEHFSRIKT